MLPVKLSCQCDFCNKEMIVYRCRVLSSSKHMNLHFSGYNFILDKGLIKEYLKWFKNQ